MIFGLVVAGHPCVVALDGLDSKGAGIEMLDGKRFADSTNLPYRRYSSALLPQNQKVAVKCYVLPDTVVVTVGDKEVIRWYGDARRLSPVPDFLPPNYSESDATHLHLGSWQSTFAIRDLKLRSLTDAEADALSSKFSGSYPMTSQTDVPFAPSKLDLPK